MSRLLDTNVGLGLKHSWNLLSGGHKNSLFLSETPTIMALDTRNKREEYARNKKKKVKFEKFR